MITNSFYWGVVALISLVAVGCIEATRSVVGDTAGSDGIVADVESDGIDEEVASPDAGAVDSTEVSDALLPSDGTVQTDGVGPEDVQVPGDTANPIDLDCLAPGCTEPGLGECALEVDWCWIDQRCVQKLSQNPENECENCDPAVSLDSWVSRAAGAACDDGISCTSDDICLEGICRGEANCSDSNGSCVAPACDVELDMCIETISADFCFIDDTCVSSGTARPDGCETCRPDIDARIWSPGDAQEPDGTFESAHRLAPPTAVLDLALTTGWSGPWDASRLHPSQDLDVFRFTSGGTLVMRLPHAKVTRPNDAPVRVCVLMRCNATDQFPDVTTTGECVGGIGVTSDTRPGGWLSCCRATDATVAYVGFSKGACIAGAEAVTMAREVIIEVRRDAPSSGMACLPYELFWGVK